MSNLRIESTEALLAKGYLLYSHSLPEPSVMTYNDHSSREAKQDGGQALRGFLSVTLLWDNLTDWQVSRLWELVNDSITSTDELMYATVAKQWNGSGARHSWIDVKGRPHYPSVSPAGGTSARLYENVTLTINNIEIVNDPASF